MTSTAHTDAFAPIPPLYHYDPFKITDDTYLIRSLYGEGDADPIAVYMNSMVILASEPVIVDTGTVGNREHWINDVFSLVEPKDVRWIFISHDDHDHTGNLGEAMAMCPNATLVTNWFQLERLLGDFAFPLNRTRWVEEGESFQAGDRKLVAVRPPVFDSPTTRGLYDTKSRVYWGGDTFATPVLGPTDYFADLDPEFRAQGVQTFGSAVSPWVHLADTAKYNKQVDRVAALDIEFAAGGHCPVLRRADVAETLAILRTLPESQPAKLPGQAELEAMLAAMAIAPAAAHHAPLA